MLSDTASKFSEHHGWAAGMGDRNGRWAMVIEKDGTISYAEVEEKPTEVTVSKSNQAPLENHSNDRQVSGAEAVLSKL